MLSGDRDSRELLLGRMFSKGRWEGTWELRLSEYEGTNHGRAKGASENKCRDRFILSTFREGPKEIPVAGAWEIERVGIREKQPHINPGSNPCHAPCASHSSSSPHQHQADLRGKNDLSHTVTALKQLVTQAQVHEQTVQVKGETW